MLIQRSYITDDSGNVKSVILDYQTFKKIEEILLDAGLLNAMQELQDEDIVDYEEVKGLMRRFVL